MYTSSAEQLGAYSKIVRVYLAEYYEQVIIRKPVSDTPFEKYKGLVVSMEESQNIFEDIPFKLSELGEKTVAALYSEIEKNSASDLPLENICKAFGFGMLERFIIVLSAMTLINSEYEKTFGYCNDNVNLRYPTLELALRLFAGGDVSAAAGLASPLLKYVFESYDGSLIKTPLKLRGYFACLLTTGNFPADKGFMQISAAKEKGIICYEESFSEICGIMKARDRFLICIEGEEGSGRKRLLTQCAREMGNSVLFIDFSGYCREDNISGAGLDIICELLMRQCYVCVTGINADKSEQWRLRELISCIARAAGQIYVCAENSSDISFGDALPLYPIKLGKMSGEKRSELWRAFGADEEISHIAANKYKFTPKQISIAAAYAKSKGVTERHIDEGCRMLTDKRLSGKAERIESSFTLDDLIIPEAEKRQILEACGHIKYRHIVLDKWNFSGKLAYGKSLVMMFEGPSGTGKTMAATIVARELGMSAYRVDISKVMSKYIGETEKSLGEIFDAAERTGSVLFFDETDALFGKRSEIKDSHDKYANVETSFLLQRLETFDGVVLMSTNLIRNIDEAFMRRISYVVHFPFPDAAQRLLLWKSMFPKEMPRDSGIDFEFLAKQFELSGGLIKNTVMSAAFLAAEENSAVNMSHLLRALKKQLTKQGRILLSEDFGKYSMFV